ncbi:MAG: hypothetical protein ABI316_07305 [Casimicrobiaceae bacterium]
MKKTLIACGIAAGMSIAVVGAQAADGHGGGGHGGGGNWSGGGHGGGGNWSGGGHGGGGNWSGGGHGGGGNWGGGHNFRGGFHEHDFRWRGFGSVFFGVPWYFPGYYYGYPSYSYYDYPTYSPTYSYYDYPTQVYVEPPDSSAPAAPRVQYYCPDAGYYPAVNACPQGWLRVVPDNNPPQ